MITGIGGLLLPFCIWFWRRPGKQLFLVLIFSVFSAAAVVVVGGFGVTPALVPAALFIGMFLLNIFNGLRYPAERPVFLLLAPFILVVAGAVASSFIMPRLFFDQVLVWPQKISSFFVRSPLAPNAGNLTQDMYLIADTLLAVTASLYLTRPGKIMSQLLDMYFISGLIVIAISFWQFASSILHIPYPANFFLSNPGWAQLDDQTMGSLTRLNGPFSEPSSLSAYMCAPLSAAGWSMMNGDKRWLPRVTFLGGIVVVLLSTASTGYVTLAGMAALLVLRVSIKVTPAVRRSVFSTLVGLGLLGGVAVAVLPLVVPGAGHEAMLIVNSVMNKTQSQSYQERSQADHDSIQEMDKTFGLGVGWGSNRSSSLFPGLCAAIGVWGVGGLAWFGLNLTWQARRAMRLTTDPDLHRVLRGAAAALISSLISALLSGPTISSPDFYLLLAMLVAATARAQLEASTYWREVQAGNALLIGSMDAFVD